MNMHSMLQQFDSLEIKQRISADKSQRLQPLFQINNKKGYESL
jgi:hypothetical protein